MKLIFIFLLSSLTFMSKCLGSAIESDITDTLYYSPNDSTVVGFLFQRKHKIKEIILFQGNGKNLIKNGYNYTFHNNGKIESISLYRKGVKSDFAIHSSINNKIDSFITPNKFNIIQILSTSIKNNVGKKGEYTFLSGDITSNYLIYYDIASGNLNRIYEATKDFNAFRNGIDIEFQAGRIATIIIFKNDIKNGEGLYFKRNGKLKYFGFSNFGEIGVGVKSDDIYDFLKY